MDIDYQNLVQSFATLVGLLCNFRQERAATEALTHEQFIHWLECHQHDELKNLVISTHGLAAEIDNLLRRNHSELLARLKALDQVFATVLSRLDGFSGLVNVLAPNARLSDQAKDLLIHFYDSAAKLMFLMPHTSAGPILCFSPGSGVSLEEPKFLEDDLQTLVSFGFLSQGYTSNGDPMFTPTRIGAKFTKMINKSVGT